MEWLKRMSLKRAFFVLTMLTFIPALFLSIGVFAACLTLRGIVAPQGIILNPHTNPVTLTELPALSKEALFWDNVLSVLQIFLPVVILISALLLADYLFYRLKLKKPLLVLQEGAGHIIKNDLDFRIQAEGEDELGELCRAFEIMRENLLINNRTLWKQAEERRRLNAAFSHDLRNPVTVLKGCAGLLKKSMEQEKPDLQAIQTSAEFITQYTQRIESYVEAMTRAQKLEELECRAELCKSAALQHELENSLRMIAEPFQKELCILCSKGVEEIYIDRQFFYNTTENLVCNALRYADKAVKVIVSYKKNEVLLYVSDDGKGFSEKILKKGIVPFLRDDAVSEGHFGMGLYICKMMCEKHGGELLLENMEKGARVKARFVFPPYQPPLKAASPQEEAF